MKTWLLSLPVLLLANTILISTISVSPVSGQTEENLAVFSSWVEYSDPEYMLIHTLNGYAFSHLDRRDGLVAGLNSLSAWQARQKEVRSILDSLIGPFPEKTPLNAKVTEVIHMDGYRIEKVLFESQSEFYVTGCLFIPDGLTGPGPAILNVIGHTDIAFRGDGYQIMILNLVAKGFIVFAIDPIGQGERKQYWDPESGKSTVGGATAEHSYVGCQCFISGVSLAKYFIWDGIRAVDYLLTRSEVDPKRIGITGISGGGTQTSYIWAFDDRLAAAAPTCYITGYRRLLESIGPQDAEQNIWRAVSSGITHADFLEVQAPKPAMVSATTRDFFSIQGARESWREALGAYRAYGAGDRLWKSEDDHGHGYTTKNREDIYRFFQQVLNKPGDPQEIEVTLLSPDDLHVTPTGQLIGSVGGRTAFDLNRQYTLGLLEDLERKRENPAIHLKEVLKRAKELSGYLEPECPVEAVFRGRWQRDGYSVEMYAFPGEGECVIPMLLFVPEGEGPFPATVYLHHEGKEAEAAPGAGIERHVRDGMIVAAPDLSGIGETEASGSPAFAGVLIGRSVVGLQAADIIRTVNFLLQRSDVIENKIGALAKGTLCPALLHAAAFSNSISAVTLESGPASYASIVLNRLYNWTFDCAVPGALTAYDLQDLAAAIAPRPLNLVNTLDQMKATLSTEIVSKEYEFARKIYHYSGERLTIR